MQTILVVEDDPAILRMVALILGTAYNVLVAKSGEEGLRLGREFAGDIDLLISDIGLPKMLGTDLAREMKILRPSLHVMLMSGIGSEEVAVLWRGDPRSETGWEFLRKPFPGSDLLEHVHALIDQVRTRSAGEMPGK